MSSLSVHLFYTDQVDEHTVSEHKSAFTIVVVPHPASCWPSAPCWMSSRLITTLKGPISDSSDPSSWTCLWAGCCSECFSTWFSLVVPSGSSYHLSSSALWFLKQPGQLVQTQTERWTQCQASHVKTHVSGCEVISSVFLSLTLCAVSRPDSRVEYVFPQHLPILMICSAWWVINEGRVYCCDPVVGARSRQAKVSGVLLVCDSKNWRCCDADTLLEMPQMLLKKLDCVSASTQIYVLIQHYMIYFLETWACSFLTGTFSPVCKLTDFFCTRSQYPVQLQAHP